MTLSYFINHSGISDQPEQRIQLARTVRVLRRLMRVPRNWVQDRFTICRAMGSYGGTPVKVSVFLFNGSNCSPLIQLHSSEFGSFILRVDLDDQIPVRVRLS